MYKKKSVIVIICFLFIAFLTDGDILQDTLESKGFVYIPETSFFFHGCKNKNSQLVTLHPFWICKHKITVGEYRDFISSYEKKKEDEMVKFLIPKNDKYVSSQYYTSPGHYDDPIRYVTLKQIEKYCEWLTTTTNDSKIVFSIINEMQWECVACEATNYHDKEGRSRIKQKESIIKELEYNENRRKDATGMHNIAFKTNLKNQDHKITSYDKYKPNSKGVYDIIGNLREITYSYYDGKSKCRVGKGAYYGDPWDTIKIEDRYKVEENKGYFNYGFRIVANYKKIKTN